MTSLAKSGISLIPRHNIVFRRPGLHLRPVFGFHGSSALSTKSEVQVLGNQFLLRLVCDSGSVALLLTFLPDLRLRVSPIRIPETTLRLKPRFHLA
ncbi:hypothetical protein V496_06735 [Pseudogymnoascus sp. VKM F-4515 (FW-2607)]|nr:hypothetical protein V496_06735 [Pseudogymnoascus sp. VKM F-4515 (FW-2607)]